MFTSRLFWYLSIRHLVSQDNDGNQSYDEGKDQHHTINGFDVKIAWHVHELTHRWNMWPRCPAPYTAKAKKTNWGTVSMTIDLFYCR